MKIITLILWLQVGLGVVGTVLAAGDIHMAAMASAWGHGIRAEFDRVRQSPDFREPPTIHGYTLARLIEGMESDARARGRIAFRALLWSVGLSLSATVVMFRLRSSRHPPIEARAA